MLAIFHAFTYIYICNAIIYLYMYYPQNNSIILSSKPKTRWLSYDRKPSCTATEYAMTRFPKSAEHKVRHVKNSCLNIINIEENQLKLHRQVSQRSRSCYSWVHPSLGFIVFPCWSYCCNPVPTLPLDRRCSFHIEN